MNITNFIQEHDTGQDPEVLVKELLIATHKLNDADLDDLIFPFLANSVGNYRRTIARTTEQTAVKILTGGDDRGKVTVVGQIPTKKAQEYDPTAKRRKITLFVKEILDVEFIPTPGEALVSYRNATLPQLRTREAFLRGKAGGILESADMVAKVIGIVVAEGVTCLGDTDEAAA